MWIEVKRKEQRPCKPPENETPKIIPQGTKAEIRREGESDWRLHYLRRDFDVSGRSTDFEGFYHESADGYEMRVHRSEVRKTNPTDKRELPPPVKMVPVLGDTYPVRFQLMRLGARWFKTEKVWKVPAPKARAAEQIVRKAEKEREKGRNGVVPLVKRRQCAAP